MLLVGRRNFPIGPGGLLTMLVNGDGDARAVRRVSLAPFVSLEACHVRVVSRVKEYTVMTSPSLQKLSIHDKQTVARYPLSLSVQS